MSKCRNNNSLKDAGATAKQARNTGFRVVHPPAAQSPSRSTANSLSTSTSSRITTLALVPKGRLAGRRKDRSHLTTQSTPSMPPSTHVDTPAPIVADTPGATDLPEDAFEAASAGVQTEPKPKRKRDNKTQVCDSVATITFLTDSISMFLKSKLLEWLSL